MAKKEEDICIKNLQGFARKGARAKAKNNIPTGHFDLDFAIHYGMLPGRVDLETLEGYDPSSNLGLPCGRVVEIYGPPGCGKSSLAYRIVGYAQRMGFECLWIDTEHSFSEALAEKVNGVDIDNLLYSELFDPEKPDKNFHAEDVMDHICLAAEQGVKVIVVDSLANLIPKERMEKSAEQLLVARLARCLSDNFAKVAHYVAKYDSLLILINQIRTKPGISYGDPSDSPGGFMVKHDTSVRIKMTSRSSSEAFILIDDEEAEDGKKLIGKYSGVCLEKNRMGKPLLENTGKRIIIDLPIYYEPYFPNIEEILFGAARNVKLITVNKGTYKWGEHKVEGRKEFIKYIKENGLTNQLGVETKQKAAEQKVLLPPEMLKFNFGDTAVEEDNKTDADEKPVRKYKRKAVKDEENGQSVTEGKTS